MTRRPQDAVVEGTLGDVGAHLRTWRQLQGLTQGQVADRAGINRGVVVRLERGEGGVSLELFVRVLRALQLTDTLPRSLDPLNSDLGRARAAQVMPQRVRPARAR